MYIPLSTFSKETGLGRKALRIYDEEGILPPAKISGSSGYRAYSEGQIEVGRIINKMRNQGFSLEMIKTYVCFLDKSRHVSTDLATIMSDLDSRIKDLEDLRSQFLNAVWRNPFEKIGQGTVKHWFIGINEQVRREDVCQFVDGILPTLVKSVDGIDRGRFFACYDELDNNIVSTTLGFELNAPKSVEGSMFKCDFLHLGKTISLKTNGAHDSYNWTAEAEQIITNYALQIGRRVSAKTLEYYEVYNHNANNETEFSTIIHKPIMA